MKFPLQDGVFQEKDKLLVLLKKILLVPLLVAGGAAIVYFLYLAANAYAGTEVKFFYPRIFCDFTQVAYFSINKDAYLLEGGSSYSALSLWLLAPFALIFKKDLDGIEYVSGSVNWGEPNMQIMASYRFWIAFLLYQAICFVSIYFLAKRLVGKKQEGRSVFLIFICSAPVVYAVLRGNMIMTSLIFVLIFLNWYQDKKFWKRETAVLALAVAGVLKLYPLFFCAFLLHDKKWLATLRMAGYFVALYLLPLCVYNGGISVYFANLLGFAGSVNRLTYLNNISLASVFYKVIYYPAKLFHLTPPAWVDKVCMALGVLFLLVIAMAAVVTDDRLKREILSLCAVALVPPVSYFYVMIFTLIPCMGYLAVYERHGIKENKKFFLCCLLLFFYPLYAANLFMIISSIILIILAAVTVYKIFKGGEFGSYMLQLRKKDRKEGVSE